MKKNNKKINILYSIIIFFLITIIINNNNIFKKTFKIIKNENYSKRIENTYGFCGGPSVGYLRFVKNRFKLWCFPVGDFIESRAAVLAIYF